jgi:hypothetical protein
VATDRGQIQWHRCRPLTLADGFDDASGIDTHVDAGTSPPVREI